MNDIDLSMWTARLRYQADISCRYHQRRAMFYSFWNTATQFLVALYGASAFVLLFTAAPGISNVALLGDAGWVYPYVGAIVGGSVVVAQVFQLSEKAVTHKVLAREFSWVLGELQRHPLSELDCSNFQSQIDAITRNEPAEQRSALQGICHNEIMRAFGFAKETYTKLSFLRLRFAQWADLYNDDIKPIRQAQNDVDDFVSRLGLEIKNV